MTKLQWYVSEDCITEDHQVCGDDDCACWCHIEEEVDFSEYDEMMRHFDEDETED